MLIDSHCHLASHKFERSEIPALLARAREAGVGRLVSLVTGLDDLQDNLDIAAGHREVAICIGIHPCGVHEAPDDAERARRTRLSATPAAAMLDVLQELDVRHGGSRGFLLAAGATEADLDRAAGRLLD